MSEPTVLIVPPQSLTASDKRELRKIGVVIIEMDDPQKARLIKPSVEFGGNDMLRAACEAIAKGSSSATQIAFAGAITRLVTTARPADETAKQSKETQA